MFQLRQLSVLNYANGYTSWHYKPVGTSVLSVFAPGFFRDATELLAAGDLVVVSSAEGGKIGFVSGYGDSIVLKPSL